MTDYVIGCTHFGHENIIRLANRPFTSVEEMDAVMIAEWNAIVKPQDTVYHLGDFAFRSRPPEDYVSRLTGRIVFLQGNHDREGWGPDIHKVKINGTRVVLCHYPIEEWDGWWHGAVHLHCHTHKHEFQSAERRGNVTVEAIGYKPMRLDEAVRRLT